ncbi:MAG: SSI family serine proteinase inhibitor [Labedaea sp.]
MRRMMISCLLAAGATAAVAGASVPAAATPQMSRSSLVLTVHRGTTDTGQVLAEETLKCEPTGGSHPLAAHACATLLWSGGSLSALPRAGVLCTMIYQPVTVEVGGSWRDRVVGFQHTYPNLCTAFDQSYGVFWFPIGFTVQG